MTGTWQERTRGSPHPVSAFTGQSLTSVPIPCSAEGWHLHVKLLEAEWPCRLLAGVGTGVRRVKGGVRWHKAGCFLPVDTAKMPPFSRIF